MRVHGEKIIKRRDIVEQFKNYRDAKEILMEDFGNMCGYCGKNSTIMNQKFHIDHFVPKSIAPELETEYSNLVLACPKCNITKSNKWPTGDKSVVNDGIVGFVDPTTPEYDIHMQRDEDGYIKGVTKLGENICKALNFHIRRTDLYWKIQQLYRIQDELEKISDQLNEKEFKYYMATNKLLKKYIKEAFEKGE